MTSLKQTVQSRGHRWVTLFSDRVAHGSEEVRKGPGWPGVTRPARRPQARVFALTALIAGLLAAGVVRATPPTAPPDEPAGLNLVAEAQARRVEMIERVAPSVACVYDAQHRGGGSGVIIDSEGYGLTNYHVVGGMWPTRKGLAGLNDGVLYDLEVLGVDPTGDVAMFRLIPPTPDHVFPFAKLGDSDTLGVGDTAIAMGNPFVLSSDYSPTVTMGIVTGIHRYQKGVRGNLTYSDCIQVDASINPGNSGGPLFNSAGEVVGINGRISTNVRGRLNVGFAYAININQVKRFMPALRAGLLARHGSLQATVKDFDDRVAVFAEMIRDTGAHSAGVRVGDRLVAFDGIPITSANHYASVAGTYPANWNIVLDIERDFEPMRVLARLEAVNPTLKTAFVVDQEINVREVARVIGAFRRLVLGDEKAVRPRYWRWRIVRNHGPTASGTARALPERFEVTQKGDGPGRMRRVYGEGAGGRVIEYDDERAVQPGEKEGETFKLPPDTAMILNAMYVVQQRMLAPTAALDLTDVTHTGSDVLVLPGRLNPDGLRGLDNLAGRILEVINWPISENISAGFAFDSETFELIRIKLRDKALGIEATVLLSDYRDVGGVRWPCTIQVHSGDTVYDDVLGDWEIER